MYSLYGFHSMSRQYREEALRDARTRHLEGWLRARSGRSRARPAWGAVLASLLRDARVTWQAAGRSEE